MIGCQSYGVQVCLIDVPFAMGDDRHEAREGGRRLFEGGGRELFARRAIACRTLRVARRTPFADTASACLAVNRNLAAAVATAAAAGELPIVYYQRKTGERSQRQVQDDRLLGRIRDLHRVNFYAL